MNDPNTIARRLADRYRPGDRGVPHDRVASAYAASDDPDLRLEAARARFALIGGWKSRHSGRDDVTYLQIYETHRPCPERPGRRRVRAAEVERPRSSLEELGRTEELARVVERHEAWKRANPGPDRTPWRRILLGCRAASH